MEVLQTSNYYIFVKNEKTLWWNRSTSEFSIKAGEYHMIVVVFFLLIEFFSFFHQMGGFLFRPFIFLKTNCALNESHQIIC